MQSFSKDIRTYLPGLLSLEPLLLLPLPLGGSQARISPVDRLDHFHLGTGGAQVKVTQEAIEPV